MSDMRIHIDGIRNVARALERLPRELQRNAEMSALRQGGKPVLTAAKANAAGSMRTGLLRKSIGITVRKNKTGKFRGAYTARIGPRTGFAKTIGVFVKGNKKGKPKIQNPVQYAHLVELGTSHSPAKPFIRPAVTGAGQAVLEGMAKGYQTGLARAIAKVRAS